MSLEALDILNTVASVCNIPHVFCAFYGYMTVLTIYLLRKKCLTHGQ